LELCIERHAVLATDGDARSFENPRRHSGKGARILRAACRDGSRDPILSGAAVSDPQLHSLHTQVAGMRGPRYLHTSPSMR